MRCMLVTVFELLRKLSLRKNWTVNYSQLSLLEKEEIKSI